MMACFSQNFARFKQSRKGAAAIEFAFMFPMVLATFCAIMFFGAYLFNANRLDNTLRDAGHSVMLLQKPTLAEVRTAANLVFDSISLPGEVSAVTIETRADGTRAAVLSLTMTMAGKTAFLDTDTFTHTASMRAPLFDR